MEFRENVPVDEIEEPTRSEKLHPYEDEEDENWEEFRASVGEEPNKPLEVKKNGEGYDLIDGDRRLRALRENDAETAPCYILDEGEDINDDSDFVLRMVVANEFRKDSDPKQRARKIAQITAPWLLKPSDRIETELLSQSDLASEVGKSQGTISNWLDPIRVDEYPIRAAVADKCSSPKPGEDDIELIDETVELLRRGTGDNDMIVRLGQSQFVAEELKDMEGVGLREVHTAAEKGVDEGWNSQRFLEYVDKNYAYDDTSLDDDVETDILGDDQPDFADPVDPTEGHDPSEGVDLEEDDGDEIDFGMPEIDVDWSEHVDDDELNGESLASLEGQRMMSQQIEDDASVAIKVLSAKTGMSERNVMKKLVEPAIVDQAVKFLADE